METEFRSNSLEKIRSLEYLKSNRYSMTMNGIEMWSVSDVKINGLDLTVSGLLCKDELSLYYGVYHSQKPVEIIIDFFGVGRDDLLDQLIWKSTIILNFEFSISKMNDSRVAFNMVLREIHLDRRPSVEL
jgi:hypothetical protein